MRLSRRNYEWLRTHGLLTTPVHTFVNRMRFAAYGDQRRLHRAFRRVAPRHGSDPRQRIRDRSLLPGFNADPSRGRSHCRLLVHSRRGDGHGRLSIAQEHPGSKLLSAAAQPQFGVGGKDQRRGEVRAFLARSEHYRLGTGLRRSERSDAVDLAEGPRRATCRQERTDLAQGANRLAEAIVNEALENAIGNDRAGGLKVVRKFPPSLRGRVADSVGGGDKADGIRDLYYQFPLLALWSRAVAAAAVGEKLRGRRRAVGSPQVGATGSSRRLSASSIGY